MKAFMLSGIENKIYFQNLDRIPAEEAIIHSDDPKIIDELMKVFE